MDRIILHCDCNCFYASCELLSHPDLRQLPVAVCGDPTERHGIILAKNEPAKRCGVKTAETIWKAKQKCPGLILLPPHHRLYAEYSKKINAVYGEYTDLVEPFGIDESWLDVTNSLHLFGGDARALADTLRGRIKREFWAPQKDLDVRKLAALEALSRQGRVEPRLLGSLAITPN